MINKILKTNKFNLLCPNQNDNANCVAIMRLTKILIKYKRWLYTIHKKSKGKDDIQRTVKVDIATFVDDDEYKDIFTKSMKVIGIITAQELECVLQSIDKIMENIPDPNTFLQLKKEKFAQIIQKYVKVSKAFALRLYFFIGKHLKQKAKSLTMEHVQNIESDLFIAVVMDTLKMMQSRYKSLQDTFDNNENDIAKINKFIISGRKKFAKLIQKTLKSYAMSFTLYDTILYSLKQRAQTQQFGAFLSDLDAECITNDYHHILKVHIHFGDKLCVENCFRYFQYAVHYDDLPQEKEECISVKRKHDRLNSFVADGDDDNISNEEQTKDIWTLKQLYVQSQLDIIHSYLAHTKWERFIQRYSGDKNDDDDKEDHKYEEEEDDDLNPQNKNKYVTDIEDAESAKYGFGIDHDHPYLHSIYDSIREELLFNKQRRLTVELFQDAMIKTIKYHQVALNQYDDELLCKYYDRNYNLIRNQCIEMRHIFAIIVYTDYSKFCTMFRKTFRKIGNETAEKVTNRHQEIYFYARCLFESIEFFGRYMDSKLRVYHGLNKVLYFERFTAYFNQAVSTTIDLQTANQFCRGTGIILILAAAAEYLKDPNKQVKYLPVSWLSCFPNEDEYLFYGEHVVFQIANIYTIDNKHHRLKGHAAELRMFNKLQKMLNNEHVNWNKHKKDMQLLLLFIRHRLNTDVLFSDKISPYGMDLFNYFCDNTNKICIYNYKLLPQTLQNELFVDNKQHNNTSIISLNKITTIFTKLTDITFTELDIYSIAAEAQHYANDILNYIKAANAVIAIRKITFQSRKQTNNKLNSTLKKIAAKNMRFYGKYQWNVDYELNSELKNVLIFTNNQTRAISNPIAPALPISSAVQLPQNQPHIAVLQTDAIETEPEFDSALKTEQDRLQDIFFKTSRGLKIFFAVLTKDSLIRCIQRGIQIVHISAHNASSTKVLKVEDKYGRVEDLSAERLKEVITKAVGNQKKGLQLVFISTSHSKHVAQPFCDAGVPHVVTVHGVMKSEQFTASLKFASVFYEELITYKKSVEEAFNNSKAELVLQGGDDSDRVLLSPQDKESKGIHDKQILNDLANARCQRIDNRPPTNIGQSNNKIVGRARDTRILVDFLHPDNENGDDAVIAYGRPKIGLTTVALQVGRFFTRPWYQAKFSGGVFCVNLQNCDEPNDLYSFVAQAMNIKGHASGSYSYWNPVRKQYTLYEDAIQKELHDALSGDDITDPIETFGAQDDECNPLFPEHYIILDQHKNHKELLQYKLPEKIYAEFEKRERMLPMEFYIDPQDDNRVCVRRIKFTPPDEEAILFDIKLHRGDRAESADDEKVDRINTGNKYFGLHKLLILDHINFSNPIKMKQFLQKIKRLIENGDSKILLVCDDRIESVMHKVQRNDIKQRLWRIQAISKIDAAKLTLEEARQLYEFDFNDLDTPSTAQETSQFALFEWLSKSPALIQQCCTALDRKVPFCVIVKMMNQPADKWPNALDQWCDPLKLQADELKDALNALTTLLTEINKVRAIWSDV